MNFVRTIGLGLSILTLPAVASTLVEEGVVKKVESITSEVGKDGKPLVGAVVGVGVGSLFGSGSGKDAAKVVGGLIGAGRQANRTKQTINGWRYIVEIKGELHVVDSWCEKQQTACSGYTQGTNVYVIDGKELTAK
jgi:uncharacterized protein YcfJ